MPRRRHPPATGAAPEATVVPEVPAATVAPEAPAATVVPEAPAATVVPAVPAAVPAGFAVKSSVPGRMRLQHPLLARYAAVAKGVERDLLEVGAVRHCVVNPLTSRVLVKFDPASLTEERVLVLLEEALRSAVEGSGRLVPSRGWPGRASVQLAFSSATLTLAGIAIVVPVLGPVAWLATAAAAVPIFVRALKALLFERRIKVDLLDAVVVSLALAFRYVLAGAFMVWMVDIGDALLESSSRASRLLLAEIFGRQARRVWLLEGEEEVEVEVSALRVADRIVLRAGERIPIDGVVLEGEALVDQHVLSGEFSPVERVVGEAVMAMTAVQAGKIVVEVRETGEATKASQIIKVIEHSLEHRVRLQSLSERFADLMVLPTLGLGVLGRSLTGPGAMMAVINADFGTGIRIAGPLAFISFLSLAARNGIVVKNGRVLESFHEMDAVIFDKTGTLTEEIPIIREIVICDPAFDEDRFLAYVACAEQRFTHPIAKAILRQVNERGIAVPAYDDSTPQVGFGVEVAIAGDAVKVGSRRYMEREGISIPGHLLDKLDDVDRHGRTAVFAAVEGRLAGMLDLEASPRPEGYRLIQDLRHRRGIREIYLLSGDREGATRVLAAKLGIDQYFAEVLPHQKAEYVGKLQARGLKVGMVGDGINDSAALARADYSVSLRGAADVATDVADVIFMDGDLRKFDLLFEISAGLRANVKRSFLLTLVPNSFCIAGALFGVFGLGTSLILNNVFNMVAIGNGLLPYYSARTAGR